MASPAPLYNGTTLVSLHVEGANYNTADLLRKSANTSTLAPPINFKICKGMSLNPLLLLALKLLYITSANSSSVNNNSGDNGGGWKISRGKSALKNSY